MVVDKQYKSSFLVVIQLWHDVCLRLYHAVCRERNPHSIPNRLQIWYLLKIWWVVCSFCKLSKGKRLQPDLPAVTPFAWQYTKHMKCLFAPLETFHINQQTILQTQSYLILCAGCRSDADTRACANADRGSNISFTRRNDPLYTTL